MATRVVIQKERGEFVNANGFTAWKGFDERGYETEFSDWVGMDLGLTQVHAETIVVGSVAFVRRALDRLGIAISPLDYPERLRAYSGLPRGGIQP